MKCAICKDTGCRVEPGEEIQTYCSCPIGEAFGAAWDQRVGGEEAMVEKVEAMRAFLAAPASPASPAPCEEGRCEHCGQLLPFAAPDGGLGPCLQCGWNPNAAPSEEAPALDPDKCDEEVFRDGEDVGVYGSLSRPEAQRLCADLRALTGWRWDWNYAAGRVVLRVLRGPGAPSSEAGTRGACEHADQRWNEWTGKAECVSCRTVLDGGARPRREGGET